MSRKQTWLVIGAICLSMLLCCAAVPAGFWLYHRYESGTGPLRRDGGLSWTGQTEDGAYRFAFSVVIRNHHDGPVRIDEARLDALPPTAEPASSGWVAGRQLLLLDFVFETPIAAFPVELAAGSAGHVVVRFRVRCAPPPGAKVRLVLRATIGLNPWEQSIGAPIGLPDHAKDLAPCA